MPTKFATATALVAAAILAPLAGCEQPQEVPSDPVRRAVPLQQEKSLAAVRLLAADLRRGTPKASVYALLGAPAAYQGDVWVYQNPGGDESLRVRFNDDGFAGYDG